MFALEYVPDDIMTPEMCEIAVKQYRYALEYVPDEMKDQIIQKLNLN